MEIICAIDTAVLSYLFDLIGFAAIKPNGNFVF
jgi:hypothetical protein